jgi:hypothetical protein
MRFQQGRRALAALGLAFAFFLSSAVFIPLDGGTLAKAAPLAQPFTKNVCAAHAAKQKYHCVQLTITPIAPSQTTLTAPSQTTPSPQNTVYGNCPNATLFTSAYNSNDAKFAGTYVNNCGPTLTNGNLHLHVDISCSGFSSGGDDASENIPSPWNYNTGGTWSYTVEGRCVECVEGVPEPVGYPPFTLIGSIDIQGRAGTTTYWNDPSATGSISMTNSSAYPLPCP